MTNYMRDHKQDKHVYLEKVLMLPYLNNEKRHANMGTNKQRFESLNHLAMIKFTKDEIIYPRES